MFKQSLRFVDIVTQKRECRQEMRQMRRTVEKKKNTQDKPNLDFDLTDIDSIPRSPSYSVDVTRNYEQNLKQTFEIINKTFFILECILT